MEKILKIILILPGSSREATRNTVFAHALLKEGLLSDNKTLHDEIRSADDKEIIHVIRFHGLGGTPPPSPFANPLGYFITIGQNLNQFVTSVGIDENVTQAKTEIQNLITKEQASIVNVAMIGYSRGCLQAVAITNELQKIKTFPGNKIKVNLLLIDPAGGVIDGFAQHRHEYNYYHISADVKSIFIFLNDMNPKYLVKSLREFYTNEVSMDQVVSFILPDLEHAHGENLVESDVDIESPLYFLLHCTRLFLQDFIADKLITEEDVLAAESGQALIQYISQHHAAIKQVNTDGPSALWRRFGHRFTHVKSTTDIDKNSAGPLQVFLHNQLAKVIAG